ncbi:hypothetical protein ACKKBF_B16790 [Auxenochlorella protothecoides x Auxenochlorella symbiontica]
MEPTRAPWATAAVPGSQTARQKESSTTHAPWSKSETRRLDVVIRASARFPEPLPESAEDLAWGAARKEILSLDALEQFLKSESMSSFLGFLLCLNQAALGRSLTSSQRVRREAIHSMLCDVPGWALSLMQASHSYRRRLPPLNAVSFSGTCVLASPQRSPAIEALLDVLRSLQRLVDSHPPAERSLRYGNPAFRDWMEGMRSAAPQLLEPLLSGAQAAALPELVSYLQDSFGNSTRIDYGTGHETTFAGLLFCLARLGVLEPGDAPAIVLAVFPAYLALMRRLQTTYWLEPAGSHGVWGLDDYQILPFLWGSAQLVDHGDITPGSIHNPAVLQDGKEEYMYLSAVAFVKQVKKGHLAETSPMLNDISGLPSWTRVNAGMIKMYQAEVLSRLPIMQHFLTGNLLPFQQAA